MTEGGGDELTHEGQNKKKNEAEKGVANWGNKERGEEKELRKRE